MKISRRNQDNLYVKIRKIGFGRSASRRVLTRFDKMLWNEKYTGRALLQKTVNTGAVQLENNGLMNQYLYTDTHEAIISDKMFMAVQQEKLDRSKEPQKQIAMKLTF